MATTLEFDITGDEARQAYRFKQRSLLRSLRRGRPVLVVAVLWCVALIGVYLTLVRILASAPFTQTVAFSGWLVAAIILMGVYRRVLTRQAMNAWLRKDRYLVGHHVLSFAADGVRETTAKTEAWWQWDVVTLIEDAQPGIFIGKGSAFFFIPRRSFVTPEQAQAFVAELRRLARGGDPPPNVA